MSRSKLTAPVLGAAALLGGGLYVTSGRKGNPSGADAAQQIPDQSQQPRPDADEVAQAQKRREHNNGKRDLLGGGVGVGANANTGGTEIGSGIKKGNTDNPNRETSGTDAPLDKLPSGGLAGGYGGGNTNTRAIEKGASGVAETVSNAKSNAGGMLSGWFGGGGGGGGGDDRKLSPKTKDGSESQDGSSGNRSASQMLQGLAGTGGTSAGEAPGLDRKNTKIMSHHADAPTNRGGSPHDKHRRDVTATSNTSEKPGQE